VVATRHRSASRRAPTGTVAIKLSSQPTSSVTGLPRASGNTGVTVTGGQQPDVHQLQLEQAAQNITLASNASGTGTHPTADPRGTGYTLGDGARSPRSRPPASYAGRFLTQYNKIMDPANGYFSSPQGRPPTTRSRL